MFSSLMEFFIAYNFSSTSEASVFTYLFIFQHFVVQLEFLDIFLWPLVFDFNVICISLKSYFSILRILFQSGHFCITVSKWMQICSTTLKFLLVFKILKLNSQLAVVPNLYHVTGRHTKEVQVVDSGLTLNFNG